MLWVIKVGKQYIQFGSSKGIGPIGKALRVVHFKPQATRFNRIWIAHKYARMAGVRDYSIDLFQQPR